LGRPFRNGRLFLYLRMKLIIAGSRYFTNYDLLKEKLDYYLSNAKPPIEIISGRCSTGTETFRTKDHIKVFGADGLGERYAEEKGYKVHPFPANWKLGKSAGPRRNEDMARIATHLIAFHSGSAGTQNMIDTAVKYGLKVRVVEV